MLSVMVLSALLDVCGVCGRPFPPHRELPLQRVWFDVRMKLFSENVKELA
jgi:hypothetical protein